MTRSTPAAAGAAVPQSSFRVFDAKPRSPSKPAANAPPPPPAASGAASPARGASVVAGMAGAAVAVPSGPLTLLQRNALRTLSQPLTPIPALPDPDHHRAPAAAADPSTAAQPAHRRDKVSTAEAEYVLDALDRYRGTQRDGKIRVLRDLVVAQRKMLDLQAERADRKRREREMAEARQLAHAAEKETPKRTAKPALTPGAATPLTTNRRRSSMTAGAAAALLEEGVWTHDAILAALHDIGEKYRSATDADANSFYREVLDLQARYAASTAAVGTKAASASGIACLLVPEGGFHEAGLASVPPAARAAAAAAAGGGVADADGQPWRDNRTRPTAVTAAVVSTATLARRRTVHASMVAAARNHRDTTALLDVPLAALPPHAPPAVAESPATPAVVTLAVPTPQPPPRTRSRSRRGAKQVPADPTSLDSWLALLPSSSSPPPRAPIAATPPASPPPATPDPSSAWNQWTPDRHRARRLHLRYAPDPSLALPSSVALPGHGTAPWEPLSWAAMAAGAAAGVPAVAASGVVRYANVPARMLQKALPQLEAAPLGDGVDADKEAAAAVARRVWDAGLLASGDEEAAASTRTTSASQSAADSLDVSLNVSQGTDRGASSGPVGYVQSGDDNGEGLC
ncbi:hypothetical protein H9P43_001985 [Blastocladiella emersonii ATCC 22665]|nr:hypothetical protein H9P43_001985 [Blastocladiella emersonii ATCC 22665]